ncbi:helix-turn-helix domain-containing protein [Streptosporangium amethystogenes]|uniref:helix-turn-helix domain-containing protein n=1 Tax=Streptosporangium amethystogenes TaxID=2002 RepID=UPI0004C5EEB3|nr:helix-turn-helix domain-containing protein [Streptosporangium amethystogenes]
MNDDVHGGHARCGSGAGASRFLIGLATCFATQDGIPAVACAALRFTGPREPVIRYADLGALALLAEVSQDASRDNVDVAGIARMADSPEGPETLDAYGVTGSLRRAADLLHLHHSGVARRIEQIGKTLDVELSEPT